MTKGDGFGPYGASIPGLALSLILATLCRHCRGLIWQSRQFLHIGAVSAATKLVQNLAGYRFGYFKSVLIVALWYPLTATLFGILAQNWPF